MDEEESYERKRPPTPAKMSKVPSWISVGLVLGVLIGLALRSDPPPAKTKYVEIEKKTVQPIPLGTVDAIFEQWRAFAVWRDDDTTEIEVWNFDTRDFSDCYEVRRINEAYFYRPIPRLTRERVNYGANLPAEAPIRFAGATARPRLAVPVEPSRPPVTPIVPPSAIELPQIRASAPAPDEKK